MRAAASLLLLLFCTRAVAEAAGSIAVDGSVVRVSADEPNLLEAQDARISAFVFAEDAFQASSDSEAGVVYFQPLQEGARSGFVETVDESGQRRRISLVLVAQRDFPAQRLLVVPAAAGPDEASAPARPEEAGLDLPRNRQIKALLRQLANAGSDPDSLPAGPPRPLAGGIEMTVIASAAAGGWQLQTALLANRGRTAWALRPADLARRDRRIVAVASDTASIAAGGSATVYLVLLADGSEI